MGIMVKQLYSFSHGKGAHRAAHKLLTPPATAAIEFHDAPEAPAAWRVANKLPAGTAPPKDAIHVAAHDPAAIPLDVKPRAGSIAAEPKKEALTTIAMQAA